MMRRRHPSPHHLLGSVVLLGLAILIGAVALPALAADPSGSPAASVAPRAEESERPKPGKAPKAAKGPEVEVTISGTVGTRTTADGAIEYTLTSGSTILVLDAGPVWFFKDAHPLKPYVGKRVTIVGERRAGATEVDVRTVDGKALREPGKPPWAGGWKRVGADHPGWTQEKWDRWQAKKADKVRQLGIDCWPPGHCKDPAAATP